MAQHFLEAAQVCASFQKMSGERMPENVRRQVMENAGAFTVEFNGGPEGLAGHALATGGDEKKGSTSAFKKSGTPQFDVAPDYFDCGSVYGYDALLIALAGDTEQAKS